MEARSYTWITKRKFKILFIQFALEVAVLVCFFLKHSRGILEVNEEYDIILIDVILMEDTPSQWY
jgi:hypothetical protein